MDIQEFLTRLSSVRKTGTGYQARCPGHDDAKPSLKVDTGDDGRILLSCKAGCDAERIVEALGLPLASLFPERRGFAGGSLNRASEVTPEAIYTYRDASGVPLAEKLRYTGKRMVWRRPDGHGGWIWNREGVQVPLYRLDEITARKPQTAFIVEGEKDADRVWSLGWPATTGPNGADSWRDDYAVQLKTAGVSRVVVLPDNDDAGRKYGDAAARSCHQAGLTVKVVALPGVPDKGDVSDYLGAHTKDELGALVRDSPLSVPSDYSRADDAQSSFALMPLSELLRRESAPVCWLWHNRLAAGALATVIGKPKSGKSTLLRCLALAVCRGEPFLGWDTSQGEVWYVALEEREQDIKEHFVSLGATDADPIQFFIGQAPHDLTAKLHAEAAKHRPALIVIDPLQRYLRLKDLSDYAEVSNKVDPVIAIARETGAAVVLSHHAPKSARDDVDAALGSIGIAGSVHTQLVLRRTEKRRTLSSLQRTGPDLDATVLELDPHTKWVTAGLPQAQADEAEAEAAILVLLQSASEPLREGDIREQAGVRTGQVARALRVLREQNRVTWTGTGRKGDPFRYSVIRNACSLVPGMGWEQENKNPESMISPYEMGSDSCSRVLGDSDTRERASGPTEDARDERF